MSLERTSESQFSHEFSLVLPGGFCTHWELTHSVSREYLENDAPDRKKCGSMF